MDMFKTDYLPSDFSDESIKELQKICFKKSGKRISERLARETARSLLVILSVLVNHKYNEDFKDQ